MKRGVKGVDCGRRWVGGGRDKAELPCWGYGGSAGHDRKCGNRGGHLEDSSRTHSKPTSITAPRAWYFYYAEWWRGQTNSSTVDQSLWNKNIEPCTNINAPPTPTQILLPLSTKTAIERTSQRAPLSYTSVQPAKPFFFLPINPKGCSFTFLHFVQVSVSVVSLLMRTKTDYPLLWFAETACKRRAGRHADPGALTYNQTQEPECPDSDNTTANSRCDSLLSKKHKTALYRKINHYSDGRPGPSSLPADLGKGGATFKSLIVLSRPCLDSAPLNHRHTYLVDADQCFVGLQKVWARCWKFSSCHVQERKRFSGVARRAKLQEMSN